MSAAEVTGPAAERRLRGATGIGWHGIDGIPDATSTSDGGLPSGTLV